MFLLLHTHIGLDTNSSWCRPSKMVILELSTNHLREAEECMGIDRLQRIEHESESTVSSRLSDASL